MTDAKIWSTSNIWLTQCSDDFVEFRLRVSYCGPNMLQKHRIGVDKSGRATYCFDYPRDDKGCKWDPNRWQKRTYENLVLYGINLKSAKKEWPKSTIVSLSEALSEACSLIGVPAPAKLLEALANATELVVTFHNFDGEFQILEAGKESKMADGSDDDDDDDDDDDEDE